MSDEIRRFFDEFEQASAAGDIDRLVAMYSDPFMSADSTGVHVVKATEFRAALPRRKQLFITIGCTSTKLVSVEETRLDDRYVMAKTVWRWEFPAPAEPIVLPSTYIIRRSGDELQVVFYLTGDVMSVLRSRGLLPAAIA
jgi:ketosteroid isomerase-like protein